MTGNKGKTVLTVFLFIQNVRFIQIILQRTKSSENA